MNFSMQPLMAHEHIGHNHGFFGELIEKLCNLILNNFNISENIKDFITHFIVDTLNVLVLLILVMTVVYFATSYVNMDKLHHKMSHLKSIWGFGLAIVAGVLCPFCSCSIIPVLIGLISMGVPVSVCLCYLTAASMLNLTAIGSLFAVTPTKFAVLYVVCALLIIIVSSVLFTIAKFDQGAKNYEHEHCHHDKEEITIPKKAVGKRILAALESAWCVLKKCVIWILLGTALSAAIMSFLPIDAISDVVNKNGIVSSLVAVGIGLPLHSDIFSIAPIISLLITISPALALTFVISTMALSVPSIVILTRALKGKTVLGYCVITVALTLITGIVVTLVL